MAKLPEMLRVGYRDYVVESWPPNVASASERYGECDRLNGIIRVREDLADQLKAEVLLHEVLHAAYDMGCADGSDEEKFVSIMGNQLSQVWRDNPQLIAFLSASLSPRKRG